MFIADLEGAQSLPRGPVWILGFTISVRASARPRNTRAVTFTLTAERTGAQIEVAGHIPVLFADYDIQNPSFAGFVTTQDHGLLEFLLAFDKS